MISRRLFVVVLILIGAGIGVGSGYVVMHHARPDEQSCVAGVGEICPSPDFAQELRELKLLTKRQNELSQDPKVKELIKTMDTQRGMAERMQGEINQTLQANPTVKWDGQKEKFVPAPRPTPGPAILPSAPRGLPPN